MRAPEESDVVSRLCKYKEGSSKQRIEKLRSTHARPAGGLELGGTLYASHKLFLLPYQVVQDLTVLVEVSVATFLIRLKGETLQVNR